MKKYIYILGKMYDYILKNCEINVNKCQKWIILLILKYNYIINIKI